MEISKTIYQKKNGLDQVGDYFELNRKILIVTDDGVPTNYVECLIRQCPKALLYVAKQGEKSKDFTTLQEVLGCMLEHNFSRGDAVIALGGGVVGDLAGMAAGIFMRGIDWYNIPTTMLAQVDSSVGGKTAINMAGIKNVVGVFHQPKGVLIDTELLKSLPERHLRNGLMEVVKTGFILDEGLINALEQPGYEQSFDEIVAQCIALKTKVVEADEKEKGVRRILNFGHTIGHGFESAYEGKMLHGEAVAFGMLAISEGEICRRLETLLEHLDMMETLKELYACCTDEKKQDIKNAILYDKTGDGDSCNIVIVPSAGSYELKKVTMKDLFEKVDRFSL